MRKLSWKQFQKRIELEDRKYNNLYCGLDVGRVNDLTVLWIIEEFPNDKPIGCKKEYK